MLPTTTLTKHRPVLMARAMEACEEGHRGFSYSGVVLVSELQDTVLAKARPIKCTEVHTNDLSASRNGTSRDGLPGSSALQYSSGPRDSP